MASRTDMRRYAGFGLTTALCLTILYVPLAVIAAYSFNDGRSITNWAGFSLRWYADVFTGPEAPVFRKEGRGLCRFCYRRCRTCSCCRRGIRSAHRPRRPPPARLCQGQPRPWPQRLRRDLEFNA